METRAGTLFSSIDIHKVSNKYQGPLFKMASMFQRRGLSAPSIPIPGPEHFLEAEIEIVHPSGYEQLEKEKAIEKWIVDVELQDGSSGESSISSTSLTRFDVLGDEEVVEESKLYEDTKASDEVIIEEIFDSYFFSDSSYSDVATDAGTSGGPGADAMAAPFVEYLEDTVGKNPFSRPSVRLVTPDPAHFMSPDGTEYNHDHLVFQIENQEQRFPREHCMCQKCSSFYTARSTAGERVARTKTSQSLDLWSLTSNTRKPSLLRNLKILGSFQARSQVNHFGS